MATKTFSGRGDVEKLAYADALTEQTYKMSYGQFCAGILLDQIVKQHALPLVEAHDAAFERRAKALQRMRDMSQRLQGSKLARMSDEELKDLLATRYE